jgi:hypothetical protein
MLGSTPLLFLQNEQEIANQTASTTYYLLIVRVIWKFLQYLHDNHNPVNNTIFKKRLTRYEPMIGTYNYNVKKLPHPRIIILFNFPWISFIVNNLFLFF